MKLNDMVENSPELSTKLHQEDYQMVDHLSHLKNPDSLSEVYLQNAYSSYHRVRQQSSCNF